ncbi:hypothetical protein CMV_012478 [Castanea mollissima]|uniref:HMA domain-containing protein n=1 Tax=Castanea mollissima TaxID=60419 RepID=A0A8J4REQ4_9ROSI|nr:hypothetical protein CMV_012478 [Castanea mollissima]
MDPTSSESFDTHYYKILVENEGLFQSDVALLTDDGSLEEVKKLLSFQYFLEKFAHSMKKRGDIQVLAGTKGQIRKNYRVVVVEFKVSMYCNACERTVAKAISKCKGVEKFTTDMKKHRVVVTGRIDPQKVLKKLKKKTGKKVEIIVKKEDASKESNEGVSKLDSNQPILFDCCNDDEWLMMFSDENPNACSIM